MLEFLIPILYPEKPTRVTVMVGKLQHHLWCSVGRAESGLEDLTPGGGGQARGRSLETQGHTDWAISIPSLHGTGVTERRRDGGIRDRPGSAEIRLHSGIGSGSGPRLHDKIRSDTQPFCQAQQAKERRSTRILTGSRKPEQDKGAHLAGTGKNVALLRARNPVDGTGQGPV